VKNILTFDLEDWYQLICRRISGELRSPSERVENQVNALLTFLESRNINATFFVTGMIAENSPGLIRKIADKNHEIASHGYSHLAVNRLSREDFKEDARRSKNVLENITQKSVLGYRAAEFSIRKENLWALDVLAELGFAYDSSIFPIYHLRYGIPSFSTDIKRYTLQNKKSIIEIPLTTFRFSGIKLPVCGGGYLRLLPKWVITKIATRFKKAGSPSVFYFHTYDYDSEALDIFRYFKPKTAKERADGLWLNFHQNLGRGSIYGKISDLLSKFEFTTCKEFLDGYEFGEDKELF